MLRWLARLLAPDVAALAAQVSALQDRVRSLEGEQITIATEWVKTRDQVLRSVKRMGSLRRGLGASESDDLGQPDLGDDPDDFRAVQAEAAHLKLRR